MKLGNLFLNKNMEIKVGDLGLSAKLATAEERKKTICGTPNYIAPEIIAGHSHSFEVDVWSLGVIMFTMLCGKPPFETKDVKSTYKKIKSCEFSFPSHVTVSHAAKSLITSILQLNADKRPTLDQMLCHEWFTGVRAVIPKRLPVSALHMEPNFFDLERKHSPSTESENSRPSTGLRASKDSGGRRPLENVGYQNHRNKEILKEDGVLKRNSSRPSSAVPIKSLTPSTATRPSSAGASKPRSSLGKGRSMNPPTVTSTKAWDVKKAKDALVIPSIISPKENQEVPQKTSPPLSSVSAALNKPSTGNLSPARCNMKNNRTTNSSNDVGGNTLKNMHLQLTRSFAMASGDDPQGKLQMDDLCSDMADAHVNAAGLQNPSVWVTCWVDYTSKYGLGYLLASGSIGVYFNDSTKIILSSDGNKFEYMERTSTRASREGNVASPEAQRFRHTLTDFPVSLNKKVTLLKHFKSYLKSQDESRKTLVSKEEEKSRAFGSGDRDMIYVKKWVKTRHAILFRMSNRTVQVAFLDKTEIILASQAKLVTYVDKEGNRSTHSLYEITRSRRTDISKRLKYTKDILQQLITGKRTSSS